MMQIETSSYTANRDIQFVFTFKTQISEVVQEYRNIKTTTYYRGKKQKKKKNIITENKVQSYTAKHTVNRLKAITRYAPSPQG